MRFVFILILFLGLHPLADAQKNEDIAVIPAPSILERGEGSFIFDRNTVIYTVLQDKRAVKFLTDYLRSNWKFSNKVIEGKPSGSSPSVLVITDKGTEKLADESYQLTVFPGKITLAGKGAGLFYGIQTLIQLFPDERKGRAVLACVVIKDQPRFRYRGMMLDVSRHFFTVPQVKELLNLMASYKLNRFHWHLTDDQGWRIEIKSYPELTRVGAWRVPRNGDFGNVAAPEPGEVATDGGFYTKAEVRDIVKYAAERHIQIMPEIDVPGHSMAAIAAYPELSVTKNPDTKVNPGSSFAKWFPQGGFEMYTDNTLNPADEKVYQFLDKVFGEVAGLFPYEYIHIGGDECYKGFWEKDAGIQAFMQKMNLKNGHELQQYFTSRVSKIILSKKKKPIGWDEIMADDLDGQTAIMNRFGEKGAAVELKKKLNVILAPGGGGLYFDYAQSHSDMEPSSHGGYAPFWKAYHYDPAYKSLSDEDKQYILGVEACVWTEHIPSVSKLQYMILPRMLALAETGWAAEANKDYSHFADRVLPRHLERFDRTGYNYWVPPVFNYTDTLLTGSKFRFELKPPVPGSRIYYTLDNRMPGDTDHEYTGPVTFTVPSDKDYILKTVVITPAGRRSVVTRTVMRPPGMNKAAADNVQKDNLLKIPLDMVPVPEGKSVPALSVADCKKCIVIAEQSQNRVAIVDISSQTIIWEWKADSTVIKPEYLKWFSLPSDAKVVYDGKYLLTTASGGGVALIRIQDKKTVFYAYAGGNTHSAELLPDGNIVTASSNGNCLTLFKVDTLHFPEYVYKKTIPVEFAHNVVWDRQNKLLWSAGMNRLKSFRYNYNCSKPGLILLDSIVLPGTEAHDLFPVYDENILWLTNMTNVYQFNVATKELVKAAVIQANIKSVSSGPAGFPVIVVRPKTSWWTDEVLDDNGHRIFQQDGLKIYKARWVLPNRFSYAVNDLFKQCR